MSLPARSDALIVGAGPIGLACAIAAARRGVNAHVVDAGAIADAIVRYPIGMRFFTTAERLEIGGHPFSCPEAKPTREEALAYYRRVAAAERLAVHPGWRLEGARRAPDGTFACTLASRLGTMDHRTTRLVLATGYFEHPNLLGVPGESLPHVSHWFDEAHRTARQQVVIIGGKNSAIEAALQCHRAGAAVTLLHRGEALRPSVKYWLRPDFENRVAGGEIAAHFGAVVREITPAAVIATGADGATLTFPADRVYALTGYHPDFDLLARLGIALDPETGRAALDPETLETNVPGLHLAGSVAAGRRTGEVFIENGRLDGERIFGDASARRAAAARLAEASRPVGE